MRAQVRDEVLGRTTLVPCLTCSIPIPFLDPCFRERGRHSSLRFLCYPCGRTLGCADPRGSTKAPTLERAPKPTSLSNSGTSNKSGSTLGSGPAKAKSPNKWRDTGLKVREVSTTRLDRLFEQQPPTSTGLCTQCGGLAGRVFAILGTNGRFHGRRVCSLSCFDREFATDGPSRQLFGDSRLESTRQSANSELRSALRGPTNRPEANRNVTTDTRQIGEGAVWRDTGLIALNVRGDRIGRVIEQQSPRSPGTCAYCQGKAIRIFAISKSADYRQVRRICSLHCFHQEFRTHGPSTNIFGKYEIDPTGRYRPSRHDPSGQSRKLRTRRRSSGGMADLNLYPLTGPKLLPSFIAQNSPGMIMRDAIQSTKRRGGANQGPSIANRSAEAQRRRMERDAARYSHEHRYGQSIHGKE